MALVFNPIWQLLGFNVQGDLGGWTFYTCKKTGLVFFLQAPPTKPPSLVQQNRHNRWKVYADIWRSWSQADRDAWRVLAQAAKLRITYYALYVYWQETKDEATIQTLERQTGITVPRT